MNPKDKKPKDSITIKELQRMFMAIFKLTRPNISLLAISSGCIIIATFSQALGLGLIIPVLNGLIDKSHFLGILKIPVLGTIIKNMPFRPSDISVFVFVMALIATAVYLENLLIFLSQVLISRVSSEISHTTRSRILERFLGFAKAFYDRQSSGELNKILIDMSDSFGAFVIQLNTLLIKCAFVFTFFILMTIISWKLTLSVFILLGITAYITRWIARKILQSAEERLKESIKLDMRSWHILPNIPLIKLYTTEEKELKKFTLTSNELKRHSFNLAKKQATVPRIIEIINTTGVILILSISVFFFFWRRDYSLGRFLVYFVILNRFVLHINQIADNWGGLIKWPPSIKKILWVFDDSDKAYIKNGKIAFEGVKEEISFNSLFFSYIKGMPLLQDITFKAKKNQMVAIVGPTGAGKTTIVNLLPRFYEYDSGSIEIDGVNIREFDLKSLRKKIGVVTQDIMVFADTIKNNITYGMDEVDEKRVDEAARNAQIYEFIMNLPERYRTFIGERGIRLSGGEKQRISIARALLKNPDILILDEATSSLDTETEILIQEAIENVRKNRTVFVIAHRLSTIKKADWIIVLENGEIKEQGALPELLEKKGRFHYYWELQRLFY